MSSASTGVKSPDDRSAWYWVPRKRFLSQLRRLAHTWPLAVISIGIIGSFVWAALLMWLVICLIGNAV